MLILVSTRIADNASYPERRDALAHDWGQLFDRYGLLPLLVPNSLADVSPYLDLGAKGLLLTGGDSLGSREHPTARDRTEASLIDGAIQRGMPIFGVCRGLQMLNRHFGGDSLRLPDQRHVGRHTVQLQDGSSIEVNSFHNDAVTLEGLAPVLLPFAQTGDGIVEGVRHKDLPITAIQWHPERSSPSGRYDEFLIKEWMKACV
jgi:gamma-glutamyl-gamma-aminobutyrate hydrolase PuuD